jgi:RNA 3'-terminal phosphate cyclase (ATP)
MSGAEGSAGDAALRAALSLSSITRQSFVTRWAPELPGLSPAGVAALQVARTVLGGAVDGGGAGSRELTFSPGSVKGAAHTLDMAGQATAPLLEMLVPPLALSRTPTQLRLNGLTHESGVSTFHDVAYGWLPLAERLGLALEVVLGGAGFAPDGAGIIEARVFPTPRIKGIDLTSRGLLIETQALALVANLGIGIALPLERRLTDRLRTIGIVAQVEVIPMPADRSRGIASVIVAQFERLRIAVVVTGQQGRPPEEVADRAVEKLQTILGRRGAIPAETVERLLILMGLAASPLGAPGAIGGDGPSSSRVTTTEVTPTLLAVADVIRKMLPVDIQIQGLPGDDGMIDVRPRPTA